MDDKEEITGPYAIYCRRSMKGENAQKDSIPAQIKACVEYWERCGNFDIADRPTNEEDLGIFNMDKELAREYEGSDVYKPYLDKIKDKFIVIERHSAKASGKRLKWKRLIRMVKAGKIKGILSYSPDRCARNMLEAGEIIDLVDHNRIALKFTNFAFENTPSGKMMLAVLFGFAKHYSDNRSALSTRGHSNKGDRGEALGPSKYGYFRNDDDFFEPHEKYWELMQQAFIIKLHQGKSDEDIAKRLRKEGFKVVTRVGRKNPDYGKIKFYENEVNYKNLGDVWIDPFYYGILTYGDARYDQRELNPYYGEPMILEDEHAQFIERSQKHYTSTQNAKLKDETMLVRPFSAGMVVNEEGKSITGGVPSLNKRFAKKLAKLQETKPDAHYGDVVAPNQIKYRRASKGEATINISADILMDAFREKLAQLHVLQEHYEIYEQFVRQQIKDSQRKLNEKRQALRMQKGRIEKKYNNYLDETAPAIKDFSPKQKERHNSKMAEFEKELKDIDAYISSLESDRRQDLVTSLTFFEMAKDAVFYYDKVSYVQKAKLADIFLLNIVVNAQKQVEIRVKPILEELFSGMVTDTGLEPVTSTMSMWRSRQLS